MLLTKEKYMLGLAYWLGQCLFFDLIVGKRVDTIDLIESHCASNVALIQLSAIYDEAGVIQR